MTTFHFTWAHHPNASSAVCAIRSTCRPRPTLAAKGLGSSFADRSIDRPLVCRGQCSLLGPPAWPPSQSLLDTGSSLPLPPSPGVKTASPCRSLSKRNHSSEGPLPYAVTPPPSRSRPVAPPLLPRHALHRVSEWTSAGLAGGPSIRSRHGQRRLSNRRFVIHFNFYSLKKADIETKITLKLCNNTVTSSAQSMFEATKAADTEKAVGTLDTSAQCFAVRAAQTSILLQRLLILPKVPNS